MEKIPEILADVGFRWSPSRSTVPASAHCAASYDHPLTLTPTSTWGGGRCRSCLTSHRKRHREWIRPHPSDASIAAHNRGRVLGLEWDFWGLPPPCGAGRDSRSFTCQPGGCASHVISNYGMPAAPHSRLGPWPALCSPRWRAVPWRAHPRPRVANAKPELADHARLWYDALVGEQWDSALRSEWGFFHHGQTERGQKGMPLWLRDMSPNPPGECL